MTSPSPVLERSTRSDVPTWNLPQRVAFRFTFLYFGLYNLVVFANTASSIIPGFSYLVKVYTDVLRTVVPWVGRSILHLPKEITYFPSGSGDKTSDWVEIACYFAIAIVGTLIWSVLDRSRPSYPALHEWLRVWVRYALAFTMVSYGMAKVIKLQFPDPSLGRLVEPLGEFSPMGVLWTFMGTSAGYTFFAGASETLGGLLLFFRRTTALGALVTGAVMLNVTMLNFCYDVPVKLLSSHLCLMCLFLLAPDMTRLLNVFVLNRPADANPISPHFTRRWLRIAGWGAKAIVVGFAIYSNVSGALESEKKYGRKAPRPPIYGIWEVEEFSRNGTVEPPLTTDGSRWRKFVSSSLLSASIRNMDDSVQVYRAQYDAAKATLTITLPPQAAGNNQPSVLRWERTDSGHLVLTGNFRGDKIVARMKRMDESNFTLLNRGFHWVSELPFNR